MGASRNTVNDCLMRLSYRNSRNIKSFLRQWSGLESLSYRGDKVATCILADLKTVTGIDIEIYDRDDRREFNEGYKKGKLTYHQYTSIAYTLVLGYTQEDVAWMMGVDQSVISKNISSGISRIQRELRAFEEDE